jgi:hypothetical protein
VLQKAPLQFQGWLTSGRRMVVSLSQHDKKHVVPTSLSGIRVGRRRDKKHVVPTSLSRIRVGKRKKNSNDVKR